MWVKIKQIKQIVLSQFWLIPAVLVVASILLAVFSIQLDREMLSDADTDVYWLFGGRSDAARSLLTAIATSTITVVAVAFSVTIVAIQQAATQYSPRILRKFTGDRGNQVVLGVYIATFLYSLIILRDVRSSEPGGNDAGFIPALSVTIALALALISVSLLVYFIHHITQLIQVDTMLEVIRDDLDEQIRQAYPKEFRDNQLVDRGYLQAVAETEHLRTGVRSEIRCKQEGYIRFIDLKKLMKHTRQAGARFVWVQVKIGDYVVPDYPLAFVWSPSDLDGSVCDAVLATMVIDQDTASHQDPMFGITQLVDVALKALSSSVNDPTTAEQCLNQIKGALAHLLRQEIPETQSEENGVVYLVNRPDFADFLGQAFSQIRRAARKDKHVTAHLRKILNELLILAPNETRAQAIRTQLEATDEEESKVRTAA